MKVFADDAMNMIQILKFILDRLANIVGKEENAPAFSPFPKMFSKVFLKGNKKKKKKNQGLFGKELSKVD